MICNDFDDKIILAKFFSATIGVFGEFRRKNFPAD